jgi:short-subunit dehydrogenase
MISAKPKKILITGGTSGLGYELVRCFDRSGNSIFTTGRDPVKLAGTRSRINFIRMDFANLNDIRENMSGLLDHVENFDIVINNAGVLGPHKFTRTIDGFEYTMQVNFLSHLLINDMIVRNKKTSESTTIVSVSSPVYRFYKPLFQLPAVENFHSFRTYSESKIYLLFISSYLLKKYPEKNLNCFSFNPGIFRSGISRTKKKWFRNLYEMGGPLMRRPEKVALRLFDILSGEQEGKGKIYRIRNNFRKLDEVLINKGEDFLKECYLKLDECMKKG